MAFNKAKAMQEAEKYVIQGKISQAIKEYKRILDKEPSDLTLLNTIGDLYYREKNTSEALNHFRQLADAYVKEGFTVKAIAIYKKIVKLESKSVDPLLKIAELYALQGLSREARDHYALAVDFYKKKNQNDKALETFRRIVALDPDNPNYRMRYADFASQAGKKDEAARSYLDAAEAALRRGDQKMAESGVKKAAQLDPHSSQLQLIHAELAFAKGDVGEVERTLESAADVKATPKGRALLLQAYLAAQKVKAAEGLVMDVFHANHDDFTPVSSFVALCVQHGDFDSAQGALAEAAEAMISRKTPGPLMDSLRQVLSQQPGHIPTLELMCDVCERTADEVTLPEALEALGHAYTQSGMLDKAEAVFRKLVSHNPENQEYAGLLNQVLQRQGKEVVTAAIPADLSTVEVDLVSAGPAAAAPPQESEEELAAVKEALENSDLFSRYGLVDKAIAALEEALQSYPDQVDIHRRILEVCHRSMPERARTAAEALAHAYTKRGESDEARKYEDLAHKLATGAPPEEFVLPEGARPAEPEPAPVEEFSVAPPAPAAPEAPPPEVELSTVFPTEAPEQPAPQEFPLPPPAPEPPPQETEFDLSTDLEAFASGGAAPPAEVAAPGFNFEESQVEIDFYIEQNLMDEARSTIEALEAKYPGNPQVAELRQRLEAGTAPGAEAPPPPAFVETRPEPVEAAEPEEVQLPESFAAPTPVEEEPEIAPPAEMPPAEVEAAVPQAAEPPAAPEPEPEPAAAGADLLGDLAGELAASMEGLGEEAPAPGAAQAGRESAAADLGLGGGEGASPLSGLLDELGEGTEAQADAEDPETHYNLGVAFREMGLLDEAIGEFQKVVKGVGKGDYPPNFLQACTLLAASFMEKGMPAIAAKWYTRALESPGIDEEATMALQYDLGMAYESAGDTHTALAKYSEVYSQNIDYRDVAEKIRQLQHKAP
jgi:tetratricopeptide (TPR) repeat protein